MYLYVLLFVALWFILRGDLLYVFPRVILFLCYSVLLVLQLPRLGKRELILVLFVRLFLVLVWICQFPLPLGGLGRAAVCDCCTPWTFLLTFFTTKLSVKENSYAQGFSRFAIRPEHSSTHQVLNWTCLNIRASMRKSYGVCIFRINTTLHKTCYER